MMAVQMHGMHHAGGVHEGHLDSLVLTDIKWLVLAVHTAIDRPAITRFLTQHDREGLIRLLVRQWVCRLQLGFKCEISRSLRLVRCARQFGNRRTCSGQDNASDKLISFDLRQDWECATLRRDIDQKVDALPLCKWIGSLFIGQA